MSAKARQLLYWPGLSRDVKQHVQACIPCSAAAATNPAPPFFFESPPEFPGDQVAADHFQFSTECYLVLLDIFSGFPFLQKCASPSTASALAAVQSMFLITGLPRVFLSDGGRAFTSHAFQDFLAKCHVRHRLSTPQNAQSNGAAERAVRTLKTLRSKCTTPFELFQAVLELQNTPRAPSHLSPSELYLGRRQRTWTRPVPTPVSTLWQSHHTHLCASQEHSSKLAHGQNLRADVLQPGSRALLRDFFGTKAMVTVLGYGDAPRPYTVQLPSRQVTQRNRSFLFPVPRSSSLPAATSPKTAMMH